jgi:hypothetical protein
MAERMWLVTQRLVAVRLPEPALSNVWWPVRLRGGNNATAEKALMIWLNSTLGLISLFSSRVPTRGPWMQFKKPNLRNLPVLDVGSLVPYQITQLSQIYDELDDATLLPFPQMATDPVREQINRALSNCLGLPPLDRLRFLLAKEPVVCEQPLYDPNRNAVGSRGTEEERPTQLNLI